MNIQELPLELVDVPPGDNFQKLEVPSGEAIHTGGLFISPDFQEVWKPLDVRPYQNCPVRAASGEDKVLEYMAGQPGFIRNWRVVEQNNRRWLVRPVVQVVGLDFPFSGVSREMALYIELAVRNLNAHNWTIGDSLNVAIDRDTQLPFILDMSNAHRCTTDKYHQADDSFAVDRWLKACGMKQRAQFRSDARSAFAWFALRHHDVKWTEIHCYKVTGELPKSLERCGISYDKPELLDERNTNWFFTNCPLPTEVLTGAGYSLSWGYSPINYLPISD